MAPDEFDRWFKSHASAFPGLWPWLESFPEPKQVLESWQECLADISFEDARQATRDMNRGEYESPPFGEHARTVRKLARVLAFEAEQRTIKSLPPGADGARYSCRWCRDTGIVDVADIYVHRFDRAPIAKFLSGESTTLPVCGLFCTCTRGRGRNPQFDERVMFHVPAVTDELAEEFRKWWNEGRFKSNRDATLDAWNRGETVAG